MDVIRHNIVTIVYKKISNMYIELEVVHENCVVNRKKKSFNGKCDPYNKRYIWSTFEEKN